MYGENQNSIRDTSNKNKQHHDGFKAMEGPIVKIHSMNDIFNQYASGYLDKVIIYLK